jgi:hypothetical protein
MPTPSYRSSWHRVGVGSSGPTFFFADVEAGVIGASHLAGGAGAETTKRYGEVCSAKVVVLG